MVVGMDAGDHEGSVEPASFGLDLSRWNDSRTMLAFTPPRPVVFLPQVAWPGLWHVTRPPVSLWIRANGVRFEPEMAALQLAWLRVGDGGYLAVIGVDVFSANRCNRGRLGLVVEASAVRPV